MILGITGGVGSGKSTVLHYLSERYGAYLIECDEVARQLQQPNEMCYQPMLELFRPVMKQFHKTGDAACHILPGTENSSGKKHDDSGLDTGEQNLLNQDGSFNRNVVARLVFSDKSLLEALNQIVHPAVKKCVRERIEANVDASLIVIEAALLLEDHYEEICDEIWYVFAEESVRRERLKKSRGYTDEKISGLLSSQRSDDSYRAGCVLTIDNSSENIQNTLRQIDEALKMRGITPVC